MKIESGSIKVDRTKCYIHLSVMDEEDLHDDLRKIFGGTVLLLTAEETRKVIDQLNEQLLMLEENLEVLCPGMKK